MVSKGFAVSKEDMLRGKEVKNGVYTLVIKDIQDKPGKGDPDTSVFHVHMNIEDAEYNGVPITHYISEKAPGMAVPFLEAVQNSKLPEGGVSLTADMLNKLIGRKVKAAIKMERDPKFGPQKRIEGWMPV